MRDRFFGRSKQPMADVFTRKKRSDIMSRIKGTNTKPEILTRKLVHSLGYRYRLHSNRLPGKPDIVLPGHQKIIFVHGCFWHGHVNCRRATLPSTNSLFWETKIARNKLRDSAVKRRLRRAGWKVFVVWQCQTKDIQNLLRRLAVFLDE
jgi:DNA mismatch endonuclease (patch repair protein)